MKPFFWDLLEKWRLDTRSDKMVKEAGSQSTFRIPQNCPKNGERVSGGMGFKHNIGSASGRSRKAISFEGG